MTEVGGSYKYQRQALEFTVDFAIDWLPHQGYISQSTLLINLQLDKTVTHTQL